MLFSSPRPPPGQPHGCTLMGRDLERHEKDGPTIRRLAASGGKATRPSSRRPAVAATKLNDERLRSVVSHESPVPSSGRPSP